MNRDELIQHHVALCEEARALMRVKNHDYAGKDTETPWMNFQRSEIMGLCKTEQAFMVRILDKISRLITYTTSGELMVKGEGVKDSIVVIINYMVLFSAFIEDGNVKAEIHHSEKMSESNNDAGEYDGAGKEYWRSA